MGFGKKAIMSQSHVKNAKSNPAPNHYSFESHFEKSKRKKLGKTFGIGRSFYDNVYIPGTT